MKLSQIYTCNITIDGKLDVVYYSQVNSKVVMVIMQVVKSHNTN